MGSQEQINECGTVSKESLDIVFVDSSEPVAIFTHPTPDPDAIASAIGLQWVFKRVYGLESTVFYDGVVSHVQNNTMINVLGLDLFPSSEYDSSLFGQVVVVDSTTKRLNGIDHAAFVIDHHRVKEDSADLVWIEEVGACSTLVWELFQLLDVTFTGESDQQIATALTFGILNDTHDLVSETACGRDDKALSGLREFADRKKLRSIFKYKRPEYYFELRKILDSQENHQKIGSFFIGTTGPISIVKRDCLAELADEYLRTVGLDTVVIFAIVGDGEVHVCMRSENSSLNVGDFLQKVFGRDFGGGKLGAGSSKIPLGLHSMDELDEELKVVIWGVTKKIIFGKLLKAAGGN